MNVEQVMQGLRFFKLSSLGADYPAVSKRVTGFEPATFSLGS